jgi:hypothetical protein
MQEKYDESMLILSYVLHEICWAYVKLNICSCDNKMKTYVKFNICWAYVCPGHVIYLTYVPLTFLDPPELSIYFTDHRLGTGEGGLHCKIFVRVMYIELWILRFKQLVHAVQLL